MIALHLKVMDGDEVIAEALVEDDPSFLPNGEMRALHYVCIEVAEPYRRRGMATALSRTVEAFATERGYDFVFGWHAGANPPIKACLLKHGWLLLDEGDLDEGVMPERWPFIHVLPTSPRGHDIPGDVLDQLQKRATERNREGF